MPPTYRDVFTALRTAFSEVERAGRNALLEQRDELRDALRAARSFVSEHQLKTRAEATVRGDHKPGRSYLEERDAELMGRADELLRRRL